MVKIKICGLTSFTDVEIVNKYLPEYVGFVFAPSKRQLTVEKALELAGQVSTGIKKVGIFVNHPRQQVEAIADVCQLDVLQFHGQESPSDCLGYSQEVWKGFNVRNSTSLMDLNQFKTEGILVDSYLPGILGGTGVTFDWKLVSDLARKYFLILAGGLNPNNIQIAVNQVQPAVVDVSSGVETNGIKDEEKIKLFIEKVRKLR